MNIIFQFVWYNILKRFFPRKRAEPNKVVTLDEYGYRMYWQLKIASIFGLSFVTFGDSNDEELQDYESMKRLPKVSANIGVGGTTADDWGQFFLNGFWGKRIYEMIKNKTVLANVGGNNVLQDRMSGLDHIEILSKMFKDIYWVNIPKVWHTLFPRDIVKDLKIANSMIKKVAGNKLIDIESVTDSGTNNQPFFFVLKDMVHFSDEFDYKVRIPLILLVVYNKS